MHKIPGHGYLEKGGYTAKSYYVLMHSSLPNDDPCKWIWQSKCIMKIKVFAWLMLNDHLNTRDMLLRRNWRSEEDLCPMCSAQQHEDRDHLFLNAISALGSGITCKYSGMMVCPSGNVFWSPKEAFKSPSSLR